MLQWCNFASLSYVFFSFLHKNHIISYVCAVLNETFTGFAVGVYDIYMTILLTEVFAYLTLPLTLYFLLACAAAYTFTCTLSLFYVNMHCTSSSSIDTASVNIKYDVGIFDVTNTFRLSVSVWWRCKCE